MVLTSAVITLLKNFFRSAGTEDRPFNFVSETLTILFLLLLSLLFCLPLSATSGGVLRLLPLLNASGRHRILEFYLVGSSTAERCSIPLHYCDYITYPIPLPLPLPINYYIRLSWLDCLCHSGLLRAFAESKSVVYRFNLGVAYTRTLVRRTRPS